MLKDAYGSSVRIFTNIIPISVRAAEISAEGVSIYKDKNRERAREHQKDRGQSL